MFPTLAIYTVQSCSTFLFFKALAASIIFSRDVTSSPSGLPVYVLPRNFCPRTEDFYSTSAPGFLITFNFKFLTLHITLSMLRKRNTVDHVHHLQYFKLTYPKNPDGSSPLDSLQYFSSYGRLLDSIL